jgi:hypothetical protein
MTCWSLNPIAGDGREIVGEFRLQNDPVSLKLTRRKRNDLSGGLVQVYRVGRRFLAGNQGTVRPAPYS